MKKLGSTKSKMTKDENGKNMSYLKFTEVVLVYCNIVNNDYQQNSQVLHKSVFNKPFAQLLDISSKNFTLLKTFYSKYSYTKIWCTDPNSEPLEVEDKITITLVSN